MIEGEKTVELIYTGCKDLRKTVESRGRGFFAEIDALVHKHTPRSEYEIKVYNGLLGESAKFHPRAREHLTIEELTPDNKELQRRLEIHIPNDELTEKLEKATAGSSEILEGVFSVHVFMPNRGWVSPDGPWDEGYATDYSEWFDIPMRLIIDGSRRGIIFDYEFTKKEGSIWIEPHEKGKGK